MTLLTLTLTLVAHAVHASAAEWPMFRRDTGLTGRSPCKGDIRKPLITGRLFAGAYEGLAVIGPASRGSAVSIPPEEAIAPDYWAKHENEWNSDGALGEFAGDANSIHNSVATRLIPELDCPQKVEFECAFSETQTQCGFLYAYDQPDGKARVVWQTEPERDMYSPIILIVDADADGVREVVVATHYRVMVYDSHTGAKKTELRWHNYRNYGFFGCFTLPGERFPKFVVVSDFARHMDVLDNDGKDLKVLWHRDIEPSIMLTQRLVRVGPNPIADLDGDGRPEITFSFFNDALDTRWHITGYDALTGNLRFDIPGAFLHGLADMDGDGLPELFVQDVPGMPTPRLGQIRMVSFKGGKQRTLWHHDCAAWQTTTLSRLPLTTNTCAADGRRNVLLSDTLGGRECYAVARRAAGRQGLLAVRRDAAGKWTVRSVATGPSGARLTLKAVRETGPEMLVSWRSDGSVRQKIDTRSARAEVVSWQAIGGPTPVPIVARLRFGDRPSLIFQTGSQRIAAYQKAADGWKECWRREGRGMTTDGASYYGVIAADLDGDAELETLFAAASAAGEAELIAAAPDGTTRWRHTFKGIDGEEPIWNMSSLSLWTVGRFTSRKHLDVFANVRRNMMHSYQGFCLSGKDGRAIWRHDGVHLPGPKAAEDRRGYGGRLIAAADIDGCGLDELICEYPDRFWVAPGKTGKPRVIVNTQHGIFPNMGVFYATPVVADFRGEGSPQALWGGSGYLTALLTMRGEPIWYGDYRDGPTALQSVADCEGTGKLYIGGAGYSDGFRCYDPQDGSVRWNYELPAASAGDAIAADVDGDGVEEFVFTQGRTLYALNGKDGNANLVWSLELPASPGPPAFADADGDGRPEIIIGASDGYVYLIGGRKQ